MRNNVLARRVAKLAIALGIALGASLGSVSAASAEGGLGENTCSGGRSQGYEICLQITYAGAGFYKVDVGIDVFMSRADAQAIIDQEGDAFRGYLIGDDTWADNSVGNIPLTWEAAGDGGIGAEFDALFHWSTLNEDWEGADEIYARVMLTDQRNGSVRTFESDDVTFTSRETG